MMRGLYSHSKVHFFLSQSFLWWCKGNIGLAQKNEDVCASARGIVPHCQLHQ